MTVFFFNVGKNCKNIGFSFARLKKIFSCFVQCFLFLVGMISRLQASERENFEKPPSTKHQQIVQQSVLVSAVSSVSCRLTRKTVKKIAIET